jgi:hypothetical protein
MPLILGGCDAINEGRDLLEGLTNPLVSVALVLGVEPPEGAQDIDLPAEFAGAGATVFLADAADVADLENAPVQGANVRLQAATLQESAPGTYLMNPGAETYQDGATWTLGVSVGSGASASADIELPPPAEFALPDSLAVNAGTSVDLTGQDFDGALVVVLDQNGSITFDNRPSDVRAVYELARGEPAGQIDIPGTAFPQAGAYLIGVAGLRGTSGADTVEKMNSVLTTRTAGKLRFEPVLVGP